MTLIESNDGQFDAYRSQSDVGDQTQYLTFVMASEIYGIEILAVQEIRGCESMTSIPNSPEFVKGVINLRGTVVPVVDLRLRFGIEESEYTEATVVIVVKVRVQSGIKIMGLVVDAVADVFTASDTQVDEVPVTMSSSNQDFLAGLIEVGDKTVVLLNLEQVLTFKS